MSKKHVPRLLASELEILEMLWRTEASRLLKVSEHLGAQAAYTTVQTRLNRMVKKGVVKRSSGTPAKYSAAIAPEDVTSFDLNLLLEKD